MTFTTPPPPPASSPAASLGKGTGFVVGDIAVSRVGKAFNAVAITPSGI